MKAINPEPTKVYFISEVEHYWESTLSHSGQRWNRVRNNEGFEVMVYEAIKR